jgi:hypothetical protein
VERGTGLDEDLGTTGILLQQADNVDVVNSTISLSGLNDGSGRAIHVLWGTSFCQTTPPQGRSLLIQDNVVVGPGTGLGVGGSHTGILLERVCGSLDREVDLIENFLEDWNFVALDLNETADVQVSCNKVEDCLRSVEIYRTVTGGALRFWENNWEALTSNALYHALKTNDVTSTALGPAVLYSKGDNRLVVHQTATKFIRETDPASGPLDPLDARQNYWYTDNGLARALLTQGSQINSRIVQSPGPPTPSVTITPFRTVDTTHVCDWPSDPTPEGTLAPPAVTASFEGEETRSASVEAAVPTELTLGMPSPNPSRGETRLTLAVPTDRTGRYGLEVFDVGGRRVVSWEKEVAAPGRYSIVWEGRDEAGRAVGPGIYFLRLRGPAFTETRRLTIMK